MKSTWSEICELEPVSGEGTLDDSVDPVDRHISEGFPPPSSVGSTVISTVCSIQLLFIMNR